MRKFMKSAPWPIFAYVLTLIGFLFLGLFVASLAYGASFAPALGTAMVAAWLMAIGCVMLRRRQIANADSDNDIVLGLDPIRGDTDRKKFEVYLQRYRNQGESEEEAVADAAEDVRKEKVAA